MGRTALMGLLDSLKRIDRRALYDTITPVNSFRVLLTRLFGAKYARLPDRSFYSTASHPFDFTDVTALIRKWNGYFY
jgi:hypothetical protein